MDFAASQILNGLGWAVIHSLWQGALAALMVVSVRAMTRDSQAALRCGVEIAALAACFTAFIFTFIINLGVPVADAAYMPLSAVEIVSSVVSSGGDQPAQLIGNTVSVQQIENYAPLLGIFWCIGFMLLAVRYSVALAMTHRLRSRGLSPAPADWNNRFRTLVLNAGIFRRVTLHISKNVSGPMTLGFFRPVVLVPASFFSGLPACQIEAILLHEIAHIRRHDYLINLIQTAIKTILFYHPAIHYISKCVDDDREQACDDFAIRYTKDPASLAKGLAALRLHLTPQNFALAATDKRKPLLRRLTRLLAPEQSRRKPEQVVTSLAALMVAAGLYTGFNPDVASAHPTGDESTHASAKLKNYTFETIEHKDHRDTIKIAADGTRWVNLDDGWHDIDKNPDALNKMSSIPRVPIAPSPNNFDSYVKFKSKADQYRVNLDYYIASLENNTKIKNDLKVKKLQKAETQRSKVNDPTYDWLPVAEPAQPAKPIPASYTSHQVSTKLAGASSLKSGIYIDGEYLEGQDDKIETLTEAFEDQMEWIEEEFETALDAFEDKVESAEDHPSKREAKISAAKKQLAKAVQKANKERDAATLAFDSNLAPLIEETVSREVKQALAEAKNEVKWAAQEASREMSAAQREMEQEVRQADREFQQEMREQQQEIRNREQEIRNQEQEIRDQEQIVRDQEQAMRDAERERKYAMNETKHEHKNAMSSAANQKAYKKNLLAQLKSDALIDQNATNAEILFEDGLVFVDGTKIPHRLEDNYCKINSRYDIEKSEPMTIKISPNSLSITTQE